MYDMEDKIGTLEEGKIADVTVMDCNMFDILEDDIPDVKVEYTFFNGDLVYSKNKAK